MESRKQKEAEWNNFLRDEGFKKKQHSEFEYYTSNKKFYSVNRKSVCFVKNWLSQRCANKRVLDYCCGNGNMALGLAREEAAKVIGIDISDVSIKNARKHAADENLDEKIEFCVMDAENMEFEDDSFDVINVCGVLHHLDINEAYSELARVLRPGGRILCVEALGHNPIIQYYRKKTPHLRTDWEAEHILKKKDIDLAKRYFKQVRILGFFHLAAIAAVPFRNLPGFNAILSILEAVDDVLLKMPLIRLQAWQVVFELSEPLRKSE